MSQCKESGKGSKRRVGRGAGVIVRHESMESPKGVQRGEGQERTGLTQGQHKTVPFKIQVLSYVTRALVLLILQTLNGHPIADPRQSTTVAHCGIHVTLEWKA